MSLEFDFLKMLSAFLVFMPIIDPLGALPIILGLEQKGEKIEAGKVVIISFIILMAFQFGGELTLRFLGVDIHSFAVAGAIILFLMALEMVCDVVIFKSNGPEGAASIVPLAFPLFAGPGAFTAIVALQVEYSPLEIIVSLALILLLLYVELKMTRQIHKWLGDSAIYIVRKFFGVVLLAIAVKLFAENLASLISYGG